MQSENGNDVPSGSTILFVDDEQKTLKNFSKIMGAQYRVLTATNIADAQQILDQEHENIGVLITDQRMPGGNGVELLTYAQEQYPEIIRLLTTAYSDLNDTVAAINEGKIFKYLNKPWDLSALKTQLAEALAAHQKQKNETDKFINTMIGEVQTSLRSIRKSVDFFDEYWSFLLDHQLKRSTINSHQSKMQHEEATILKKMNDTITHDIDKADAIMDILPSLIDLEASLKKSFSYYSVKKCLEHMFAVNSFDDPPTLEIDNDFVFHGSDHLLAAVLGHLASNANNAIKQSEKGHISIILERGEKFNRLYFKDTAIGINSEILPKIFEHGYTSESSSAGIGLAFCKQIMQLFDGDILCESTEGMHTTFILEFPTVAKQC